MNLPINYPDATFVERRIAREQYKTEQGGRCAYCKEMLSDPPSQEVKMAQIKWGRFPKGFQKYPVHLHHCHKTGMTIGAVHARCNAYLWQYKGE